MRGIVAKCAALVAALLIPSAAFAQAASLTGTVRDPSGAVLPGVTVEVTSDALIERMRTATSDGAGQWRVVDLRPGLYSVTFSLEGFTTVRRDGIELSGTATLTVPAELRVGNLQETITVTGETPVVDVQSTRRETVLGDEVIQALPATRGYGALLQAIPGITVAGAISAPTTPEMTFFTAHGGSTNEGRVMIDGMNVAAAFNGGGVSSLLYDTSNAAEIQVLVSGGLGESETGGPSMNLIPRSGGNRFAGSAFWNGAGDWSRSENINDELRAIGIVRGPALINSWDVSGSYGGPVKRDRVWFYATVRNYGNARANEGAVANRLAGTGSWEYERDESVEARTVQGRDSYSGRLTAQVTARNRVSFSHEYQLRCEGSTLFSGGGGCRSRGDDWVGMGTLNAAPESVAAYMRFPYWVSQATWTSPMTNRLLLEAGYSRFSYEHAGGPGQLAPDGIFDLIPVTEQSAIDGHRQNFTYRGLATYNDNYANPNNWRASASYVTGSHSMKVGYQGAFQRADSITVTNEPQMSYRFNQRSPNQFTIRMPNWKTSDRTMQHSLFVQDQWTLNRLTVQGALRYDHAYSWSPAEHNGTTDVSRFNAAPIAFERTVSVRGYDDVTPRFGAAYDVFGNGRTAVKMNVGKYLDAATNDGNYVVNNPANRIVDSFSRSWVDTNGNRVVDCDILDPAQQTDVDTCGALTGNALNFGQAGNNLTQVNPAILGGWGVRPHDWQFGVAVQQELLPRVSVDLSYNRRWWGNNFVTDNLVRSPGDYQQWSYTAPVDPRLPRGGGYTITQYTVTAEAAARASQNYVTFETDFGPARTDYWHGVDVTFNARLGNGLVFQGGTSTGRGVEDTCATAGTIDSPDTRGCRDVDPFQTTFRGLASYTVPKVDVLVSASMRSLPGAALGASLNVPNTVVRDILGRLPPGATANGNTGVNLLSITNESENFYAEDRTTQVDMRFAKIFRFGGTRADLGVDLYNLFNTADIVGYDGGYDYGVEGGGNWLLPTAIVQPRFVRLNVTLTF